MRGNPVIKWSKAWVAKDIKNARELSEDKPRMRRWILSRLLQIGASDNAASVRALEVALDMPEDAVSDLAVEVDDVDRLKEIAAEFLRDCGYSVEAPHDSRSD